MKRCCYIGLCLLQVGRVMAMEWRAYERLPDDEVAHLRVCFKDPEKLKESLMYGFTSDHGIWPEEMPLFIKKFDISESTLRTVLMEIIRESAKAAQWKPVLHNFSQDEFVKEKCRLIRSIEWLSVCADETAKKFLMEIAVDETKGEVYRNMAVGACIRSADAKQVKDALHSFLVEGRVVPSSTYSYARAVYEEAEGDPLKREAIVNALTTAALAIEEDRGHFARADKIFAEQDKVYAKSPQRKAALQQMNLQPPSEPVENKSTSWKLPLLIGILILGGGGVAWRCFRGIGGIGVTHWHLFSFLLGTDSLKSFLFS